MRATRIVGREMRQHTSELRPDAGGDTRQPGQHSVECGGGCAVCCCCITWPEVKGHIYLRTQGNLLVYIAQMVLWLVGPPKRSAQTRRTTRRRVFGRSENVYTENEHHEPHDLTADRVHRVSLPVLWVAVRWDEIGWSADRNRIEKDRMASTPRE
jgi:hypothetical protein